ncbi:hypothetical protein BD289DRAFT_361644 [Coniella lustricola]|uniref:Short-chain dehydrogenase n=1 Tax=Coniella lustricola TaxID=2025994 RepID=A0A2T3AHV5_9PEZI|nr:hypothetical protein BD289DRAFT_361644 [Coniella lustricola]
MGLFSENPFTVLASLFTQVFPAKPTFTDKDIGDLEGKVYIVTGANTGVGKHVAKILFAKNAKVYCAARSEEKAVKAIQDIQTEVKQSRGELVFLKLDLADLSTIRASAEQFLAKEDKLHVLFNNAGVMYPPQGSKTAQGYELQLGVNNLGPFLFTKFLTPTLVRTARASEPSTVRVVWVASLAAEALALSQGGIDISNLDYHVDQSSMIKYGVSKAGNYYQGVEFARRHKEDGIVSVPLNPGNLDSDLWRGLPSAAASFIRRLFLSPSVYGAYTELFAGLSTDVTIQRSGEWVIPWGRFAQTRAQLLQAAIPASEGGTGEAERFWEWQEEQVRPFL